MAAVKGLQLGGAAAVEASQEVRCRDRDIAMGTSAGPEDGWTEATRCGESRSDSPSHSLNVSEMNLSRITHNPAVMGGKPCIRGLRVTVSTIVGLLASGETRERILQADPLLESADIDQDLAYAAWRLTATKSASRGAGASPGSNLLSQSS